MNKCLYCYKKLSGEKDFHEKCSLEFFGTKKAPSLPYRLEDTNQLAQQVVERSIAVPGVQPKLSLSLIREARARDGRFTIVGALGGNFILKPPSEEFPELPANEHLSMRMAQSFGIKVVPSSLVRLQSGELAYITQRIDRTDQGEKIHMLDMFQILEAFDKYKGSMEKIGKAIGSYSANTLLDKLFFFEMSLFSFLTGNNDMHLKNFSLIDSAAGWSLAPAYDLLNVNIANPDDPEELALPIAGKKKKLTRQHFEDFGEGLGLTSKQVRGVFQRFYKNKAHALQWLRDSFLSKAMQEQYLAVLEERYERMETQKT